MHIHLLALAPKNMEVRTYLPLAALGTYPNITTSSTEQYWFPELPVELPKVAILQRAYISDTSSWIPMARDLVHKGWLLVTEVDDHPILMTKSSRCTIAMVERSFWGVHAVQTSTGPLAEVLREHNPNLAIFRNSAFSISPVNDRQIPLRIFFGALNRQNFSSRIGASLSEMDGVEFIVVNDRAFFEALGSARKQFSPNISYQDYLAQMASSNVVLSPLEGSHGEQYKSDLKFIEAAGVGAAMIASPTVYAATIRQNVTGIIAETPAQWRAAVQRCIDDPTLCQRLATAAQDYVRGKRLFSHQAPRRIAWYEGLWKRRVELTSSLGKRLHDNLNRGR